MRRLWDGRAHHRGGRPDQRHGHGEHAPAPNPRTQSDAVTQALRNPLDDREAQARAALGRLAAAVETLELEKDPAMMLRRDPGSAIPDLDAQRSAGPPASHEHAPAPAVTHGVGKIVLQD